MHSLFFKLYFSITAAIVVSFFMINMAYEYYDDTDMFFVRDVESIVAVLDDSEDEAEKQHKIALLQSMFDIEIDYLTEAKYQDFIDQHELIDIAGEFAIYDLGDDDKAVLVARNGQQMKIGESADFPDSVDELEQMENAFDLFGLAFVFTCIAMVLYISVRNIAMQVNHLSIASAKLAEGQWETRVDENIPAPLQKMAQSFNHMATSLQHIQNQQKIMANAIAHELRTPLTRMQLALGLLMDTPQNDFTQALHQDINNYALEMEYLANDILMLQTLEHQDVEVQNIDLTALIKTRQHDFQRQFSQMDISAKTTPQMFDANNRLVCLILDNLIRNACVYAKKQVHIESLVDGDKLLISVSDDGSGIAENLRQQVLEPFTRLDNSRSRQTGGFGLGLAIVNSVVKKMKGEISITESKLGGACFTVYLPY